MNWSCWRALSWVRKGIGTETGRVPEKPLQLPGKDAGDVKQVSRGRGCNTARLQAFLKGRTCLLHAPVWIRREREDATAEHSWK